MNKEYVYKDGKATIIDENNNQKTVDYYDNLDEVLVKENLIEKMEKDITVLEEKVSRYESKPFNRLICWAPFLSMTLLPLILGPIISNFFGLNESVNTIIGMVSKGTLNGVIVSSLLFLPSLAYTSVLLIGEREKQKEQKGNEMQLKHLKKSLVLAKEHLEKLKLDKTNTNEIEDSFVSKVGSNKELRKLNRESLFYYKLGYNEEKYFKYYQQGTLENHLSKFDNYREIPLANQYFQEKEKVLQKK